VTVLTRWEPFRKLSAMQDRMNRMSRLFRDSNSPENLQEALTTTGFAPPVEIYEDGHTITLKLESRASTQKIIDVRIENNMLTVHAVTASSAMPPRASFLPHHVAGIQSHRGSCELP
jgi:HSP20 family protein